MDWWKIFLSGRAWRKESNDICRLQHKTALGFVSDGVSPGESPEDRREMCIIPRQCVMRYCRIAESGNPDMEHVSQTNHARKKHDNEDSHKIAWCRMWGKLGTGRRPELEDGLVLNATVYGVMKRCLKKKVHCRQVSWTTVNHDTSRTNVASTCIEQNVVKNQLNAQLLLVALLYTLHGFVILQAFAAREPP